MTSDDVLDAIRSALRDSLSPEELADIDVAGIRRDTPMLALALDSLALMIVVDRLEERTGVHLAADDVYRCAAVGELADEVLNRTRIVHR